MDGFDSGSTVRVDSGFDSGSTGSRVDSGSTDVREL
jgi:hypothetical protein